MLELYKRVPKSEKYLHGSRKINDEENPFLEGPCMLCISAQPNLTKSIFGLTKCGMSMARLRTRDNAGAKIDLEDFQVSFLSIKGQEDEEIIEEFVNKYFLPLVSKDEDKIQLAEAMKNVRNINIISYCDGTDRIKAIIEVLNRRMEEIGYGEHECLDILSQACLFSIATEVDISKLKTTCICFHDLNDDEVMINPENINEKVQARALESENGEILDVSSNTKAAYVINGTGEHCIKKYLSEGNAMPVCLSRIVANALENSIVNSQSEEFKPIDMTVLTSGCDQILEQSKRGKSRQALMQELDTQINYPGCKKLSDREVELLNKMDKNYDRIASLEASLEYETSTANKYKTSCRDMQEAAKEYCTEGTYLRIIGKSDYQLSKKNLEIIDNSKSDVETISEQKEQIERQQKQISNQEAKISRRNKQINNLQGMLDTVLQFADRVRNSRVGKLFFRNAIKQLPEGMECISRNNGEIEID